jgi:hypothetical protein
MSKSLRFLSLFVLVVGAMTNAEPSKIGPTWFTAKRQHEGFPLLLRFPEKRDFDLLEKQYTKLLLIRHQLDKVLPSGLPEPAYNETLFEFDEQIVGMFGESGIPVLVETFGGRRNYYIYVLPRLDISTAQTTLKAKYPTLTTAWTIHDGTGWKLIRRYSTEYGFYK